MKKQISPLIVLPVQCIYTNKQRETLPTKVKGKTKIVQEGIKKD